MAELNGYLPITANGIQICCISLKDDDLIQLIVFPPQLIPAIRIAIQEGWGLPIQRELDYNGIFEFKLRGKPWYGQGEEGVMSRRLITSILKAMARYGWNLSTAASMSKMGDDKDTMFFENALPDPTCQIFSISFNMSDRIRVIDAPEMIPYVKDAVITRWQPGIQAEREYFGSLELKLNGSPWEKTSCAGFLSGTAGLETVHSRLVLVQIILNLKDAGFKLYGSIDLSTRSTDVNDMLDLDSLFFRKVGLTWQ